MKKTIILFFIAVLFYASFAAANNQSGHSGYLWYDTLSDCATFAACSSYTQAAATVKLTDHEIHGRKWLTSSGSGYMSAINLWASNKMEGKGASKTNQISLRFLVVTNTSATVGIVGLFASYVNRATNFIFTYVSQDGVNNMYMRVNDAGAETSTTRSLTFTAGKVYDVCMTVGNKSMAHGGSQYGYMTLNTTNGTMTLWNSRSINMIKADSIDSINFYTSPGSMMFSFPRVWQGNCSEEPTTPPSNPIVSLSYPTNKTHYNTNWNKTIVIATDKVADCTLNDSAWTATRHNGLLFNFDRATTPADGNYSFQVRCNSSGSYWRNTTFWLVIDNTVPIITISSFRDHSGTGLNMSKWNSSWTMGWTASDKYLYAWNMTGIRNSTGAIVLRPNMATVSGETMNKTQIIFNNASYTTGNWYKFILEATDSHTATEVPEFADAPLDTELSKDSTTKTLTHDLIYGNFKLTYPVDVDVTPIREADKISYEIKTKKIGASYQIIEADSLDFIENSEYPCHFVVNFKGMKGYAYDCVGLKNPVITELIKGKKYRIDYDLNDFVVKEESLVGLNYARKELYLYFDNVKPTFIVPARLTTTHNSVILNFNTSEATNYTYYLGSSCTAGGTPNGSSSSLSTTHILIKNGLRSNTSYKLNVTVYDASFNINSRCYNFTTNVSPNYIASINYDSGTHQLVGNCTNLRKRFLEWKWFVNGTEVLRGDNITGAVNATSRQSNTAGDQSAAYDLNWTSFGFKNGIPSTYIIYSNYNNLLNKSYKYSYRGRSCDGGIAHTNASFRVYVGASTDILNWTWSDIGGNAPLVNNSFSNISSYFNASMGIKTYTRASSTSTCNGLYETQLYYSSPQNNNHIIYNITGTSQKEVILSCRQFDGLSYTEWFNSSTFFYPVRSNITIRIFNERTLAYITQNVSLVLIGDTDVNTSTINGTKRLTNLTPGDYEILYGAPGYHERTYYFTLDEEVDETINLYLLTDNVSISTRVIYKVYDQIGYSAPNITVYLMRKYGANYITVSTSKTNYNGETLLYTELYDVVYKLLFKDNDGRTLKMTDPFSFYDDQDYTQLQFGEDIYWSWRKYNDMRYNLSVINSTGIMYYRFIWGDENNIVRTACLVVKRISSLGLYSVCNNCSSSSVGTLTCVINPNLTGEYTATALIDTNSTGSYWNLQSLNWKLDRPTRLGQSGVFYGMALIGTIGLMGIGGVTGSLLFLVLGAILSAGISLIAGFTLSWLVYLFILASIIIFMVVKR